MTQQNTGENGIGDDEEMIDLPVHPLKRWGEKKRREKDEVCTKCGDDLRETESGFVCPACATRGNPEKYPNRKWLDTEELLELSDN